MLEKLNEECGVFGVYTKNSKENLAYTTYVGLCGLQHRGEESCGIAVNEDGIISHYKDLGLVANVFTPEQLGKLPDGKMAIGHVRYSTTGSSSRENAQPIVITHKKGNLAVVHNGNIMNALALRQELEDDGAIFSTTSDTEVICHVIVKERLKTSSIEEAVMNTMKRLKGSYSLVIMTSTKLLAVRDPQGFRPLCIGTNEQDFIFSSESCALEMIGANFVRDVKPGEIISIQNNEMTSMFLDEKVEKKGLCVFEYIYFSRPDSTVDGINVHSFRENTGRFLAKQAPVEADIVAGVPDSGLDAALGYSKESGIPYDMVFTKSKYIGRTFIQNLQSKRQNLLALKLNPLRKIINGKKIVLVDDSIIRGTTIGRTVKAIRDAGAKEIHLRIAAPAFIDICYFGTDVDNKKTLIAANKTVEEIRKEIGVDSLEYLSMASLTEITKDCNVGGFCSGCFTGKYPMEVPKEIEKDRFEKIKL